MLSKIKKIKEHYLYFLLIALMIGGYFYTPFISQRDFFGFNQLKYIGLNITIIFLFIITLLAIIINKVVKNDFKPRLNRFNTRGLKIFAFIFIFLISFVIFFLFKNEFINPDGLAFEEKFYRDTPIRGAHVTHDEMWELFIHSRFWYYTYSFFRWPVSFSYQFLSSLAGGIFIVLLILFCKKLLANRALLLFFAIISLGFMQLFFGDVENYTLVSVLILAYLFSGYLFIKKEKGVILPSLLLSIAICFHLLVVWLLPSLLYLYFLSYKRRKYSQIFLGILLFIIILIGTLIYFHFNGLPIKHLFSQSHALGHGGQINMFVYPSLNYYFQILNLLFLLLPPVLIIIPLIIFKRLKSGPFNIFMGLAAFFMLIFVFIWRADLGVYNDWNLFAPAIIPLSIFCWYNFLGLKDLKYQWAIYYFLVCLSFFHSYSFIIANHFS